ncbi:MAG: SpoIIE family protein phosphatase [Acidobacteriaceae bacterium]|nr:SpoIIE family protein phosphatase [Acidobacteriaceae bacterium]
MPSLERPSRPTLQYVILGVLFAWALIAQLTISIVIVYGQATPSQHVDEPFATRSETVQIHRLSTAFQHSGLQVGDDILAENGQPVFGAEQLDNIMFHLHPGESLTLTVRRTIAGHSEIKTVTIRPHSVKPDPVEWSFLFGLFAVLPLACLLLGFFIAFARPTDPLAWITLGMLASFGQLVGAHGYWAVWSPWREIFIAYHSLLNDLWPAWMVLFAFYFPVPSEFARKHRRLTWLTAAPLLLFCLIELYLGFREGNHMAAIRPLVDFFDRIENPLRIFIACYIAGFFALLGYKRHTLKTPDARRRMRVMSAGCSLALVPILFVILSEVGLLPPFPFWLVTICLLMLVFFPITMAYVIVVQRAMDVRMVIRSGVRYALASTGVKFARIVLITATVILFVNLAIESHRTWAGILIGALGSVIVSAFGRLTGKFKLWMDRRFFREAYNAELVLTDLSNSVATIRDTRALLETVARRIADSLHVSRIAMLLERGALYQPAYALGYGASPAVQLRRDTATVRFLKQSRSPAKIYFDDPQSWVHAAPDEEQTALQELGAQVLLPVSLDTRLLGVISLGPKKSDAPYSQADLQLLSAVASQTGLALENAELTESIRREVAQRERLDRELEIAREVQQRLFPQKLPTIPGLEFAGYCRPALGVGGDYYDFVPLDNGCLGIAIGDVSGKGIAAALMMASLQASLRGQTLKPSESLCEMIHHVNRLVYEASAENRYATFFYAQYDPATRLLHYVNAGHNPPMLCRHRESHQVIRLEEGGTVIGLFPDFPYREAAVPLEPHDVLVAFTDGISEAMNHADEEFDEQRLMSAIQACDSLSAPDMIRSILANVDTFTAGAPQHDDMTLLIVRAQ